MLSDYLECTGTIFTKKIYILLKTFITLFHNSLSYSFLPNPLHYISRSFYYNTLCLDPHYKLM